MKQALRLVRETLGPSAVIVSSRSLRKDAGLFGLLGRKVLEVTAAVEKSPKATPIEVPGSRTPNLDYKNLDHKKLGRTNLNRTKRDPSGAYQDIWAMKQAIDPVLDEVRSLREAVGSLEEQAGFHPSELRSDLGQIRTMLASMAGAGTLGADEQGAAAQRLFYFLMGRGLDEPLTRSLVQRVVAKVETGSLGDLDRLKLNLAAEMRADLSRAERGSPASRVQVFIGPTGVGKTTTIAKLAARAARSGEDDVLIITTDVHRVAAVEQMLRFGEMISVPVEVALSPEELTRRIDAAEDKTCILVDTAGRNHRDSLAMRQLSPWLEAAGDAEAMLVLSAAMRPADSREIIDAYDELRWSRLIMTKLDETRVYGELYNCVVRSNRPLACICTGQSVPEHLESIDISGILRKVLHG
ncbi:MAG: flagellar biosynthesis protein FlhF [bacterium]|nr:flagellar biosynthesis protein FlhF [bacterium]